MDWLLWGYIILAVAAIVVHGWEAWADRRSIRSGPTPLRWSAWVFGVGMVLLLVWSLLQPQALIPTVLRWFWP